MLAKSPHGDDDGFAEPPRLRNLRRLVTALTLTLIFGVLTIVGVLVIRLLAPPAPVAVPESVQLPAGESARAVTMGEGWIGVVTRDEEGAERLRILDALSGRTRATVLIEPVD